MTDIRLLTSPAEVRAANPRDTAQFGNDLLVEMLR